MSILRFRVSSIVLLLLCSCQSTHTRNEELVKDRVGKLQSLSDWRPTWCRIENELTQPALARTRKLYAQDLASVETFTWKARETTCELTPLQKGALTDQQSTLLQPVFCTLLQVFFVNSPFDGLKLNAEDVSDSGDKVRLRTAGVDESSAAGLYLTKANLELETRTRAGRVLKARYGSVGSAWLPLRLETQWRGSEIVVDEIEYSEVPIQGRRLPSSFWLTISQGETSLRQSQVRLTQCQAW